MAAATARGTSDACIFALPSRLCARRSIYELGFDQQGYARSAFATVALYIHSFELLSMSAAKNRTRRVRLGFGYVDTEVAFGESPAHLLGGRLRS